MKTMRMHRLFPSVSPTASMSVTILVIAILQLSARGHAQAPPAGSVTIKSLSYTGNGCPPASAGGLHVSDDGQSLRFEFGNMTAVSNKGKKKMTKTCTMSFNLSYPPKFVYSIRTVAMRGYAKLHAGVKATVQTSYFISSLPGLAMAHQLTGALDDNFEFTDYFVLGLTSQCDKIRALNIQTRVRIEPGNPPKFGLVTMEILPNLTLDWKPC